jgi:hypothetical protein
VTTNIESAWDVYGLDRVMVEWYHVESDGGAIEFETNIGSWFGGVDSRYVDGSLETYVGVGGWRVHE